MPKEFKDPGFWYASRFAVMAFAINTKCVPKGSIKSYTDLVKPEFVDNWKGKVTGSDPRYRGSGVEQFFALRERYGLDWWKPFAKLNIKWATGGAQEESWLASGEAVAGIGLLTYRAAYSIEKGAPLEIIWPAEGAILAPTAVPRKARGRSRGKTLGRGGPELTMRLMLSTLKPVRRARG